MSRRISIDEEVAGGLLRLLGYASHSMNRARQAEDRHAADNAGPATAGDPAHGEPGEGAPAAAAEQLFDMLKLASRGESPPKRPHRQSEPGVLKAESEPASVRPERARSAATQAEAAPAHPPFPDQPTPANKPTERTWRRAMTLPSSQASEETRQVILWLEACIALDSATTDPSGHDEEG